MNILAKVLTVLAFFFLTNGTVFAQSGEQYYAVKAGDWLAKIARKFGTTWPEIAKANALKDPDKIYPNTMLLIPSAGKKEVAKEQSMRFREKHAAHTADNSDTGTKFLWKNPGKDPCMECGAKASITKLRYPEDVGEQLFAKIEAKDFTVVEINYGDRFDAMLSGKSVLRRNVSAAWTDGHTEVALQYRVVKDNTSYALYFPIVCGNWAKKITRISLLPPTQPPKEEAPEIVTPHDQPLLPVPPLPPEVTPPKIITEVIAPMPCNCPEFIPLVVFEPLPYFSPSLS